MWPYKVDAAVTAQMPPLAVPPMKQEARAAFLAILEYEKPMGNGSVRDYLGLAEARGYCAHPFDWVPSWKDDPRFPELYQPWVDWLAENGHSPFHTGVSLTEENWDLWKPGVRAKAFRMLLHSDRTTAHHLLTIKVPIQSAAVRLGILREFQAQDFDGNHPSDVPILEQFLADRSDKVRALAEQKIKDMNGLLTEEDHAQELTVYFKADEGRVELTSPAYADFKLRKHFQCTTFDHLAAALNLSPGKLANNWDLGLFSYDFLKLVIYTGDEENRLIVAGRAEAAGITLLTEIHPKIPQSIEDLRLSEALASQYPSTVIDVIGPGKLDAPVMREWHHFQRMAKSVIEELEQGRLPVNKLYDPLRILGLAVTCDTAKDVREEALSSGMSPENPRLTMLNFNIALG
ncbi:MAG: DUF5691 domain-containing protein [Pseudomonadota bacterium]